MVIVIHFIMILMLMGSNIVVHLDGHNFVLNLQLNFTTRIKILNFYQR